VPTPPKDDRFYMLRTVRQRDGAQAS
jgi:hypothetical protein